MFTRKGRIGFLCLPCLTASAAFLKWASKGFSFPLYWPEESWRQKVFSRHFWLSNLQLSKEVHISHLEDSSWGGCLICGEAFGDCGRRLWLLVPEWHVNKDVWGRWMVPSCNCCFQLHWHCSIDILSDYCDTVEWRSKKLVTLLWTNSSK